MNSGSVPRPIIKLDDSFLERQTIRLLCFAIGGMSILTSLQLLISFFFADYATWVQQVVDSRLLDFMIMISPAIFGTILLVGKITKIQKIILYSLFLIWVYNLAMALFNGIAYAFQGTPMMLHLTVGLFALILHGYYNQRGEAHRDKDLIL